MVQGAGLSCVHWFAAWPDAKLTGQALSVVTLEVEVVYVAVASARRCSSDSACSTSFLSACSWLHGVSSTRVCHQQNHHTLTHSTSGGSGLTPCSSDSAYSVSFLPAFFLLLVRSVGTINFSKNGVRNHMGAQQKLAHDRLSSKLCSTPHLNECLAAQT